VHLSTPLKTMDIEKKTKSEYDKSQYGSKERKNKLKKGAKFDFKFIEPIAILTALGLTEKEIGIVFGVTGYAVKKWKQRYPDLKDAVAEMKSVAASHLVAQMVRSATGYDYEEEDISYKTIRNEETDKLVEIQVGRKVKKRQQPGNPQLAMFLTTNLLPDQFKNRFELTKRESKVNINLALTGKEIREFSGRLLDVADEVDSDRKQVESKVIENE